MITTLPGWLKVGIAVDGVVVGVLFTDTKDWNPYPVCEALTEKEWQEVRSKIQELTGRKL